MHAVMVTTALFHYSVVNCLQDDLHYIGSEHHQVVFTVIHV